MLQVNDRVKYTQPFLACFKGKERKVNEARRGVIVEIFGVGAKVKWDNEPNEFPNTMWNAYGDLELI